MNMIDEKGYLGVLLMSISIFEYLLLFFLQKMKP